MKWSGFLVVTVAGPTRVVKSKPAPAVGEVLMPLHLDLPDVLFAPPTTPVVEITIDERSLPVFSVVSDSMDALQEAGVKVRIVEQFKEGKQ